jgi:hypothetical protein
MSIGGSGLQPACDELSRAEAAATSYNYSSYRLLCFEKWNGGYLKFSWPLIIQALLEILLVSNSIPLSGANIRLFQLRSSSL